MSPDTVTLRDYIERIFEERQVALDNVFQAHKEALALATRNLENRLENLNELRQEVTRDRGEYITRVQYDADMREIRTWRDQADGGLRLISFVGSAGVIALLAELARIAGIIHQ